MNSFFIYAPIVSKSLLTVLGTLPVRHSQTARVSLPAGNSARSLWEVLRSDLHVSCQPRMTAKSTALRGFQSGPATLGQAEKRGLSILFAVRVCPRRLPATLSDVVTLEPRGRRTERATRFSVSEAVSPLMFFSRLRLYRSAVCPCQGDGRAPYA